MKKITMHHLTIRKAGITDGPALQKLVNLLGYSVDVESTVESIKMILSHSDHILIVADIRDTVIGFLHGQWTLRLTGKPFLEICGLFVTEDLRRQGIATQLIDHAHTRMGKELRMRVRTNIRRNEAEEMYTAFGFKKVKTQLVMDYIG